jgi:hypothetical protein
MTRRTAAAWFRLDFALPETLVQRSDVWRLET